MGKIILQNIKLHANPGCLIEEAKSGSEYRVDLSVKASLQKSAQSDQLADTVDYVTLNTIVKEEMNQRSELLEHVAQRILDRIMREFPNIQKARVSVAKINPPIGGNVENVSVIMKIKKEKKKN